MIFASSGGAPVFLTSIIASVFVFDTLFVLLRIFPWILGESCSTGSKELLERVALHFVLIMLIPKRCRGRDVELMSVSLSILRLLLMFHKIDEKV